MTTQYNITTYGTLTNTNGVLSNFSASNYATLPLNFNQPQQPFEIVFKFNSNNISDEQAILQIGNFSTTGGSLDIEVYNSKLYFELDSENTQRCYIEGVRTLSSNTDYWGKLTYNGIDTYSLYLSTNGTTWTTEGTATSSYYLGSTQYSYIGINQDLSRYYFNGSIDLNESYIDINGIRWWQGVTSTSNVRTRIQLRHDTAANWTSVNPILLVGEVGLETDTLKQKVGDGSTAWNSLPYDAGSTALQSITSTNVTTALGYTPSDTTLSNVTSIDANSAVQTALDGKVSKSGDTMTGDLTAPHYTVITNFAKGTNPTTTAYHSYAFDGNNNSSTWYDNRLGMVELTSNTDGSSAIALRCYKNEASSTANSALNLYMSNTGVATCLFPKTICCDGQWVFLNQRVINSATSLVGTTPLGPYTVNVPNDGHKYELLLETQIYSDNAVGNFCYIKVNSSEFGITLLQQVSDRTATNWGITSGTIVLGTNRELTVTRSNINNFKGYVAYLTVVAYRRIGTNS